MQIRTWRPEDVTAVVPMIQECLRENYEAGADMMPTGLNATLLWNLGLHWSQAGEPSLVAVDDRGRIIGYTLWGGLPNPLGLEFRDKACHGLGTYVKPWARHTGVATAIRNESFKIAKDLGYSRIVGVAYHWPGLKSCYRLGFEVKASQVEKAL